jgi:3-deoxy-D-manno-octulosonic-acid transferase
VLPRLLYSALLYLVAPLVWTWLLWRARKAQGDWQVLDAQRFGRYSQPWDGPAPVWIHAVSVGEVRAAVPLVNALVDQGETVLLTHFTPTGWREAQRVFGDGLAQGRIRQQWVPYDFPGATKGFVRHFAPKIAILMEREVWPNLIDAVTAEKIPLLLASARMSERSYRQSIWLNRFLGGVLHDAYTQITRVLAQTQDDASRLYDLGAPHVQVAGNLKFDVQFPAVAVQAGKHWRTRLARDTVVIASTREGEDKPFIQAIEDALKTLPGTHPSTLYVLIPRHPQRFDAAARLLDDAGCRYARWSVLRNDPQADSALAELDVVLGDTMGELPFFYAAADVSIVGGSFQPHGGQNFIEASAIGSPVIVGPHTANFADAVTSALAAQAIYQAQTPQAALRQAQQWLTQPEQRRRIGYAAQAWVLGHIGATQSVMQVIGELHGESMASITPTMSIDP